MKPRETILEILQRYIENSKEQNDCANELIILFDIEQLSEDDTEKYLSLMTNKFEKQITHFMTRGIKIMYRQMRIELLKNGKLPKEK